LAPLLVSRSMHPAEFSFGGPAGGRTRVRNAFALKGLQQFFNYLLRARFVARRAAWRTGEPLR